MVSLFVLSVKVAASGKGDGLSLSGQGLYDNRTEKPEFSTIKKLFPNLTPAELADADFRFEGYLKLALDIFNRYQQGGASANVDEALSCTLPGSGSSDLSPPK